MGKKKSAQPTNEELRAIDALIYDTLLYGNPVVATNVKVALHDLLVILGRGDLAGVVSGQITAVVPK